jgi:hypothetical protein
MHLEIACAASKNGMGFGVGPEKIVKAQLIH